VADAVVTRFPCYVESVGSLSEAFETTIPTIAELRMLLRDRCADDNALLQSLEFGDDEIILALRRPVDYWNGIAPSARLRKTVANFPYRYQWMDAAVGELLRMAAHGLSRNRLAVQGSGFTADDKSRAELYLQLGTGMIEDYKVWAVNTLKNLNIQGWAGSLRLAEFGW